MADDDLFPDEKPETAKSPQYVPETPKRAEVSAFQKFYDVYPRKKSPGTAIKAWEKLTKRMTPAEEEAFSTKLRAAIRAQVAERKRAKESGEKVPDWKYPATWLNGMCWEDEVITSYSHAGGQTHERICSTPGCHELTLGPRFKHCITHLETADNWKVEKLREYYKKEGLSIRPGESKEDHVLRLRKFALTRRVKKIPDAE